MSNALSGTTLSHFIRCSSIEITLLLVTTNQSGANENRSLWLGGRAWLNNLSAIRDIRRFKGFEYAEQYLSLFLDSRASMGILEGFERRCG